MSAKVTILVPNYKTAELTKLCLRLIRQKTPRDLYKVIVIDNQSQDASTDYLRSLPWITLLERETVPGEPGYFAHARALDLALAHVDTPYVLSIHTDTFVLEKDWLDYLIKSIEADPNIAAVGAQKDQERSIFTRIGKVFERPLQRFWLTLTNNKKHVLTKKYEHLRSHCALFRMDLIRKYQLNFFMEEKSPGRVMHKKLLDAGYQIIFLPRKILNSKIEHLYNATMILHPELGTHKKTVRRGVKKIRAKLSAAQTILNDTSLDA